MGHPALYAISLVPTSTLSTSTAAIALEPARTATVSAAVRGPDEFSHPFLEAVSVSAGPKLGMPGVPLRMAGAVSQPATYQAVGFSVEADWCPSDRGRLAKGYLLLCLPFSFTRLSYGASASNPPEFGASDHEFATMDIGFLGAKALIGGKTFYLAVSGDLGATQFSGTALTGDFEATDLGDKWLFRFQPKASVNWLPFADDAGTTAFGASFQVALPPYYLTPMTDEYTVDGETVEGFAVIQPVSLGGPDLKDGIIYGFLLTFKYD